MGKTIIETLAEFSSETPFSELPDFVVEESKRVLLDSVGCAVGGVTSPKGRMGVDYGRILGASSGEATIIGTSHRSSAVGAGFANGELINALDFDAVLPPGHVSPYVIPGLLAVAEGRHSSGREIITAVAIAHELSFRFSKSMDYHRDIKNGEFRVPAVLGCTSTVFGATAAIGRIKGLSSDVVADALGIAGSISPVNSQRSWLEHTPLSTIKYTMAGPVVQTAITAAYAAELGHRGDREILDDAEYGYPRFIGTTRWEAENLTDELGVDWRFPAANSYKPYPHCRNMHAPFDALTSVIEENDIKPEEITAIRAWGEAWIKLPLFLNNNIGHVLDGQMSIAHGLAVAAQRIPPGPAWQDPKVAFSPAVLDLMKRVTFDGHPDYVSAISQDPAARPSRVEVDTRGATFVAERHYPKGSRSSDPASYMTTQELVDKFLVNAEGILPNPQAKEAVQAILELENADDIRPVMRLLAASEQ
ncbi:MmgE/PrpD family protein [Micrococcaceae bacterium Sec5.1]